MEINYWLFGKPAWEMDIDGKKIDPQMLKDKGEELKQRLDDAANVIKVLEVTFEGALYDMRASLSCKTEDEARQLIKDKGLDPEDFSYLEEE